MNQSLIQNMVTRYPALSVCADDLTACADLLCQTFHNDGKLLVCGNGGSAADAEHISGELLKQFVKPRSFSTEKRHALGTLCDHLQPGLPAIPLVSFTSLITAYSNDCAPEYVFAQLVQALSRPGDTLLAISTSGNSRSVNLAARTARALKLKVIGLTGRSGGALSSACDLCIKAPSDIVFEIQEYHLPLYHTLCLLIEDQMFA